jgi:hypothetical protein
LDNRISPADDPKIGKTLVGGKMNALGGLAESNNGNAIAHDHSYRLGEIVIRQLRAAL